MPGIAIGSRKLLFVDANNGDILPINGDVVGTLTAPTAIATTVSKVYATPYVNTPTVLIIPTQNCGNFFLSASSNTGFTVTFTSAGTHTFQYLVISND
jgi:hypothetical protein